MPKLLKIEKYSSHPITVLRESPNRKYLLIGARGDKDFWVLNASSLDFECFFEMPSEIKDISWLQFGSNTMVVGILENTCLFSV